VNPIRVSLTGGFVAMLISYPLSLTGTGCHGDLADNLPLDDQINRFRLRQDPRSWVSAPGRVGIDLEQAAGDVHDPVRGNAAAAVGGGQSAFLGDVPPHNLDDQGDVVGPGMVIAVIADPASDHRHVRLRLAVPRGDADGIPTSDMPARRHEIRHGLAARFGREHLRGALPGLLHDAALDQLEPVGLGQDPVLDHLVVLIDGQSFLDVAG